MQDMIHAAESVWFGITVKSANSTDIPLVLPAGPLLQPLDIFGSNRVLGALCSMHELPALVVVPHHVDVKIGERIVGFARASIRSDPELNRLFEIRDRGIVLLLVEKGPPPIAVGVGKPGPAQLRI